MNFLTEAILGPILKIIDKAVPDATEKNRLQSEITKTLIEKQSELNATMREIAIKEIGGTKFQSYWRPTLAWIVVIMWPYNYIIRPLVVQATGALLPEIPSEAMVTITGLWTSVYGLSRTMEKTGSSIQVGTQK